MKNWFSILIVSVLFILVFSPKSGHNYTRRLIKIGINKTLPLDCYHGGKEKKCIFQGIIDYIAQTEDWDTEYIEGTPDENIERLEYGKIDLISHAVCSKELREKLTFTRDTIISSWAQVYTHEKSDLQSLLDLANLSVGVVQDDPYNQKLRNILRQFDVQCKFIEFKSYKDIFRALKKKWIDAGVTDRLSGILYANDYKLLKTAIIFSPMEFRFAFKKNHNPDLINTFDYHISMLKKDPKSIYYGLINQIFYTQEKSEILMFLKWSLIVTAGFLFVSTGAGFILRSQIKAKTIELVHKNEALENEVVQRREAEKALEESEERYRSVFENTGTAIIIIEENMTISMANNKAAELVGYSKEDIQGKMNAIDFVFDEDREMIRSYHLLRGRGEDDMPSAYEFRLVDRNGHVKNIFIRIVMIPETQRRTASLFDITEQKRMEKEHLLLVTAIEQSSESIFITDSDNVIQYVNPAFVKITGYAKDDVIGQVSDSLYSNFSQPRLSINPFLESEENMPWKGHLSIRKRDGNFIETETTVSPILDDSKTIINYIHMHRDVTAEAQLERQLRQAQKIQAIGTLAGGIAHDFNNILAAIIGYTELAYGEISEGKPVRLKLERVLEASFRAKEMVKQILTFSRKSEQERQPVDIGQVVKEAMNLLRASIPKTIDIRIDIRNKTAKIVADPTQVHQILMNLCTNAAHAMREKGGILNVTLENIDLDDVTAKKYLDLEPGPYIRLSVSDTGHGMDSSTLERIFEPFFTTKKQPEGSGLGLSVVHGIVKSHGGSIRVYSELGKGSTFRVYFPRLEKSMSEKQIPFLSLPNGNETILFVDDEIIVGEVGKEMLESLGYHIVLKTDGVQALEIFRNDPNRFDLVITDQTMPGLTGYELSRELMACRSDIPIILCTGFSEVITADEAKSIGIREFVFKPYTKREIAEMIRKVLKQ